MKNYYNAIDRIRAHKYKEIKKQKTTAAAA